MTKATLNTLLMAVVSLFLIQNKSIAQDALWQLDFDREIEWTKITEAGVLLVGTKNMELIGIDSRDGNKIWETELLKGTKSIKGADGKSQEVSALFDQYVKILFDPEVPEMSDFAEIKFQGMTSRNFAILNLRTGDIVISPEKAGMPVAKVLGKEAATFNFDGSGYIPSLRAVVISATWIDYATKGSPEMTITKFVDMPSGKVRWESSEIGTNVMPFPGADKNLIIAGSNKIAKLDAQTGEVIWSFETTEKKQTFEKFDTDLALQTGYFFEKTKNNGQLTALDLSSGQRIWAKELKLKDVPQMFAIKDGLVTLDEKYLTLYDLSSGNIKWESKIKDINYVIDVGEPGLAVAAKGKSLKMINRETGEIKWEEKIVGVNIDQMVGKGMMYTDEKGRLGIITYDGEKVWEKKGMLEAPEVRYRADFVTELMYFGGTLYKVDLKEGTYSVLRAKIDKEFGSDQTPDKIEYVDNGYLISSANNLLMLEENGDVRFFKNWEAPGMSLAAKIALRALQVAAAASQAANSYNASVSRSAGNYSDSKFYESQADRWNDVMNMAGAEAKKRFTATKDKGNIRIVLSLVGKGGQSSASGFVKVDKRTGEEMAIFQIGDKSPIYDYDPVSGQVFLKADKKQIISYSF